MILGTEAINQAMADGAIVCDPAPARVEGAHIDVRLGRYYWVFNLDHGQRWMGLRDADPRHYFTLHEDYSCVEIPPRGCVLAHTEEYVGVAPDAALCPTLHTRSTLARWFIGVHPSAGWGDPQYCSRWTLEIVNPHDVEIAIPIGARAGCVAFHHVEGAAAPYTPGTRYNATRAEWTPESMLPKKGNW